MRERAWHFDRLPPPVRLSHLLDGSDGVFSCKRLLPVVCVNHWKCARVRVFRAVCWGLVQRTKNARGGGGHHHSLSDRGWPHSLSDVGIRIASCAAQIAAKARGLFGGPLLSLFVVVRQRRHPERTARCHEPTRRGWQVRRGRRRRGSSLRLCFLLHDIDMMATTKPSSRRTVSSLCWVSRPVARWVSTTKPSSRRTVSSLCWVSRPVARWERVTSESRASGSFATHSLVRDDYHSSRTCSRAALALVLALAHARTHCSRPHAGTHTHHTRSLARPHSLA